MNQEEKDQLTKSFNLDELEYYLWTDVEDGRGWLLSFRTYRPEIMIQYCTRTARRFPNERIKVMYGTEKVMYEGIARNFGKA